MIAAPMAQLNDEVRSSLLRLVELADAAEALSKPSSLDNAGDLLAAVETARHALVRLMSQVSETDFAILSVDLALIADRILDASRELLAATRLHAAS